MPISARFWLSYLAPETREVEVVEEPGTQYGETVVLHMRQEACRTLLSANLLGQGLRLAPDLDGIQFIARRFREETQNFMAMAQLHEQLVESSMVPWVMEQCAKSTDSAPETWGELCMAHWLFERRSHWQGMEYTECSWVPYQTLMSRIIREKRGLQNRAERLAVDAIQENEDSEQAKESFAIWLQRILPMFGRPGDTLEEFALEAGIRRRKPADVLEDFLEDIKPGCRMAGLELPPRDTIDFPLPKQLDWSL